MNQTKDSLWQDCIYRFFANQPCPIQNRLEDIFDWHTIEGGSMIMPTLGEKGKELRVNFCPVCGTKIRYLKIEKP